MSELKHTMLSNGLDFIDSGISGINGKDIKKLKYGILHLFAGTTLVLKERLNQEHWALLYDWKKATPSLKSFEQGDFVGVDHKILIEILEDVCQISISFEDKTALKELQKIRNKAERFQFNIKAETVKHIRDHFPRDLLSQSN